MQIAVRPALAMRRKPRLGPWLRSSARQATVRKCGCGNSGLNVSNHYATLRAALSAGELGAVRSAAHAIAGSSANLSLTALAQQCKQIEGMAIAGIPIDAIATLEELGLIYEATLAALTSLQEHLEGYL